MKTKKIHVKPQKTIYTQNKTQKTMKTMNSHEKAQKTQRKNTCKTMNNERRKH